ncbi:hypothetical protein [Opitutus terrae]|uniref:Uncharacterized protein n=1 Tax=Opitutus terrae (strain DSM 11246 / JCM 15787 / PB90-1) TaxID=452637 RepID=B1ZXY6_OPITP|nr:hypothetical protein [Opitutus terrae]ACB75188.1 hypothetical protein Oter_1905 [Opitutus terrae PB90-1]
MKSSKTLALLAAISVPCLAIAEFFNIRILSALDGGTLIGLFSLVLLGLISVADYSRRSRITMARARCGHSAACEVLRLAA